MTILDSLAALAITAPDRYILGAVCTLLAIVSAGLSKGLFSRFQAYLCGFYVAVVMILFAGFDPLSILLSAVSFLIGG